MTENKEIVDITNKGVEIELSDEAKANLEEATKYAKMPKYMICEHTQEYYQKEVSIFNLNLEELVFEKMFLMFERLVPANANLENSKIELQIATDKILLETDFKALGLTNEKMRTAHIKTLTGSYEDKVDECKDKVEFYRNKLTILNDLISTRRLELKIETTLNEEE